MTLLLFLACGAEYGVALDRDEVRARVAMTVAPEALDLGAHDAGATASAEVRVGNEGSATLYVEALELAGSPSFAVADPGLPLAVGPGETEALLVTYTASDPGEQGWLTVHGDDPLLPEVTVALTGSARLPRLAVAPSPLDFGPWPEGDTTSGAVTLGNVGAAPLTVHATAVEGAAFAQGSLLLPAVVDPGASIELPIGYTALSGGDQGWLRIGSDDPVHPDTSVPLRGRIAWPDAVADPDPLDFGVVARTLTHEAPVHVRNAGEAPLAVTAASIVAGPAFAVDTSPLPVVLPIGGAVDLVVRYAPASSADTGALRVETSDPDGPLDVALLGAAAAPELELGPDPLDFGTRSPGAGTTKVATLRNLGPGPATVFGVALDGAGPFALTGAAPSTLAEGAVVGLKVAYDPTSPDDRDRLVVLSSGVVPELSIAVLGRVGAPELVITPDPVVLDLAEVGCSDAARATFTNVGDAWLDVRAIALPPGVSTTKSTPFGIPAGKSAVVELLPTDDAPLDATAWVTSNDPRGQLGFHVLGSGGAPELSASPDPVVFEVRPPGCPAEALLQLHNDGTGCLVVERLELPAGLSTDAAFPVRVEPGAWRGVVLRAAGDAPDLDTDALAVPVAPLAPVPFGVVAPVGPTRIVTDDWVQPEGDKADVLVYVDQSCSMGDDIGAVSAAMGDFADALTGDVQVMVVTADSGCHTGRILSASDADFVAEMQAYVWGVDSSWTEAGLELTRRALENSSGCNVGFLREEAARVAVLISDEPEQSGVHWSTQVSRIEVLAMGAVPMAAIVGPVPGGCVTADAGNGYVEAANATGGVFLSICDPDWGEKMAVAASLVDVRRDAFRLSAEPTGPIELEVDGAPAGGWSHDEAANAVVFAVPPPSGARIVATYPAASECGP